MFEFNQLDRFNQSNTRWRYSISGLWVLRLWALHRFILPQPLLKAAHREQPQIIVFKQLRLIFTVFPKYKPMGGQFLSSVWTPF